MNKTDLLGAINALSRDSLGGNDTDLASDRADSMDHYFGRPYGTEQDGRSKIVSRDLAETVDWIMPSLMRTFFQSGLPVEFDPVGAEDEDLAEQESDYTNYIITKKNNGFMVFHDWFKDALLLKNGYVKTYVEEKEVSIVESYENLLEDQLTMMFMELDQADVDYEVINQEETEIPGPEGIIVTYNIKIRITEKKNEVIIDCVPPEELRVSKRCKGDLNKADFIEHFSEKTRTDLIEMGMKRKFVDGLPASTQTHEDTDQQTRARSTINDDYDQFEVADSSMELVEFREIYIFVDYDDDGKAERRKVIVVGNQIPDGDEWNEEIDMQPFSYITPKRMPHRHVGEPLDDDLKDLQEIKTVLQRGMLDNIYGLTNVEWLVNQRVNLDDFLQSKPLGVKRVGDKNPVSGAAEPVIKPNILDKVLPCIDYVDKTLVSRTGVKPSITALDPNSLQEVREKPFMDAMSNANAKIEMIARLFAEIGVKDLALKVHANIIKYIDKADIVKLRGEYVTVNPREWKTRTDLTVNVGLGVGSREEVKGNAMALSGLQDKFKQSGLVEAKHEYNVFSKFCKSIGELNPSKYMTDPNSPEFQQKMQNQKPPVNPLVEVEEVKGKYIAQISQMKEQMKAQSAQHKQELEHQQKVGKIQSDIMLAKINNASKENIAIMENEVKALIEGFKIDIGQPGIGAELGL